MMSRLTSVSFGRDDSEAEAGGAARGIFGLPRPRGIAAGGEWARGGGASLLFFEQKNSNLQKVEVSVRRSSSVNLKAGF